MIPKSLWMKRHQPELFAAAARICEYQDYINWRLTGRWVASLNNMSVRWHYQSREGGVPLLLDREARPLGARGEMAATDRAAG